MEHASMTGEIETFFTIGEVFVETLETPGERIYWLRRKTAKLKQKELAAKLGVSQGYLSEVEANKKEPSAVFMARVADALNTTLDFLMLRTDDPATPEDNKPTLLSTEAEQIARMVDDMPPEGRASALRSVTGIYKHYEEHTTLNRHIRELLALIEASNGLAFRRDLERRLGLLPTEKSSHPISL